MMMRVFILLLCVVSAASFQIGSRGSAKTINLKMHFEEADNEISRPTGSLQGARYIATNRFNVRPGKAAKFEKRWADRKSRLAQLEGFRFFTLLKRVDESPDSAEADAELGNYISYTIWQNKDNFNVWRTGDAFKEAHGGGKFNISGFVALLTTALFILKGSPKPAFYDGLLPVADTFLSFDERLTATAANEQGGWRKVAADGKNEISPEIFVSQELFTVFPGQEVGFEQFYDKRLMGQKLAHPLVDGKQESIDNGMLSFVLMRRDAIKADDGINYIGQRVWTNKKSYQAWSGSKGDNVNQQFVPTGMGSSRTALYEGKLTLFSDAGP